MSALLKIPRGLRLSRVGYSSLAGAHLALVIAVVKSPVPFPKVRDF